jgi:hypothetical protein
MDAYPEGTTPLPTDSEQRALAKLCQKLYDSNGPGDAVPFPEGNRPLPSDDEQKLLIKINALS